MFVNDEPPHLATAAQAGFTVAVSTDAVEIILIKTTTSASVCQQMFSENHNDSHACEFAA